MCKRFDASACSAQTLPSPGRTSLPTSHTTRRGDAPNGPRGGRRGPDARGTGRAGPRRTAHGRRRTRRPARRRCRGDRAGQPDAERGVRRCERTAQPGTTGLHVVAQPHRTGQQLGLEPLGRGPAAAAAGGRRRRAERPATAGADRCRAAPRGAGDGRRHPEPGSRRGAVRSAATTAATAPRRSRARDGGRSAGDSRPPARGDGPRRRTARSRRRCGDRRSRQVWTTESSRTVGMLAVADVAVARTGAPAGGVPGHRHLLGGRPADGGGGPRTDEVALGQAEGGEVGPGRLLDTAEDHPDPHLAGAVGVVPPAEQFTRPTRHPPGRPRPPGADS